MEPAIVDFDGKTYDRKLDRSRLVAQLERVKMVMCDNQWRTLKELSERTGDPEASISARLRDLRKAKFGGYVIERERVSNGHRNGLHRYRLCTSEAAV